MMGRALALVIVDGHTWARTALVQWLERVRDVKVLAAVGDLAAAMRLIGELAPDVVLLEPRTVDGNPALALPWLASIGCPVVIWTSSLVDGEAETLRRAGAAAVLLKNTNRTGLLRALEIASASRHPENLGPEAGANGAKALSRKVADTYE